VSRRLTGFARFAEQGDARAENNLGLMYRAGHGLQRNDVDAVNWYRKAADQGYAPAQCDLGSMYLDGLGVARDDVEALDVWRFLCVR
jgi:hypothetical protein